MKNICIGDRFEIHCYKHNGHIHRAWDEAVVLEINKNYMVLGNNKTQVIEKEGVTWRTKEPAIMYFFKDCWYNVIAQLKKNEIYFYCNIATPYILEENTIKYIDYDLDLRIFPNGEYKILDRLEYNYHKRIMNYSDDLDKSIHIGLDELIKRYSEKDEIFSEEKIKEYYNIYKQLKENEETSNFF